MIKLKTDKTKSLLGRSNAIVDTFTKTVIDLGTVNDAIEVEEGILADRQRAIASQRDDLSNAKDRNTKIATKIKEFLS